MPCCLGEVCVPRLVWTRGLGRGGGGLRRHPRFGGYKDKSIDCIIIIIIVLLNYREHMGYSKASGSRSGDSSSGFEEQIALSRFGQPCSGTRLTDTPN